MKTDNEVLAEFDGWVEVNNEQYDKWHRASDNSWESFLPNYDKWEILMPVWYKFKELDFSQIDTTFKDRVANAILHSGCAEACKLLAEGIRWYQSIKK